MQGTNLDVLKMERAKLSGLIVDANAKRSNLMNEFQNTERAISRYEEKALKKLTGVEVYRAGDYAGLSVGKYKFYFGYEATMCTKHADCSCEDKEWCFTADVDDVEVMRVPESGLGQKSVILNLLHGIGQFLSKL